MILTKLVPNEHVPSIYDINLTKLKEQGIRGIITDLDNTLIEWNRPLATPELIDWLQKVEEMEFKLVVVSNNNRARVSAFADPLGIPFIHAAKKPFNQAFVRSIELMGIEGKQVAVIGDQLFTDVLGGNRLQLYTILVTPVAQSDGFFTKFNRLLEKIALHTMRKKGMITWEK